MYDVIFLISGHFFLKTEAFSRTNWNPVVQFDNQNATVSQFDGKPRQLRCTSSSEQKWKQFGLLV